jgi:hypothetical protein
MQLNLCKLFIFSIYKCMQLCDLRVVQKILFFFKVRVAALIWICELRPKIKEESHIRHKLRYRSCTSNLCSLLEGRRHIRKESISSTGIDAGCPNDGNAEPSTRNSRVALFLRTISEVKEIEPSRKNQDDCPSMCSTVFLASGYITKCATCFKLNSTISFLFDGVMKFVTRYKLTS